jgi:hypothetical protein
MAEREDESRCQIEKSRMKKVTLFTAIFSLFFINACTGKQLSENGRANENSLENGQKVQIQNMNADMVNAPSNSNLTNQNQRPIVNGPMMPNAKPVDVPRPYNSTMSTSMDKQGKFVETRKFKDDPQISKVERMQQLKKVKLYLRSGKVIDLPFDKVGNIFVDGSPAELLQLAGIKPPSTPVSTNPAKVEQMKKNQ